MVWLISGFLLDQPLQERAAGCDTYVHLNGPGQYFPLYSSVRTPARILLFAAFSRNRDASIYFCLRVSSVLISIWIDLGFIANVICFDPSFQISGCLHTWIKLTITTTPAAKSQPSYVFAISSYSEQQKCLIRAYSSSRFKIRNILNTINHNKFCVPQNSVEKWPWSRGALQFSDLKQG